MAFLLAVADVIFMPQQLRTSTQESVAITVRVPYSPEPLFEIWFGFNKAFGSYILR